MWTLPWEAFEGTSSLWPHSRAQAPDRQTHAGLLANLLEFSNPGNTWPHHCGLQQARGAQAKQSSSESGGLLCGQVCWSPEQSRLLPPEPGLLPHPILLSPAPSAARPL